MRLSWPLGLHALIERESAYRNWWNYSSLSTTALSCFANQMLDFCWSHFGWYWIHCCCYCCCCCWGWHSVDSFRFASDDRHNHSRIRFYYHTNKTGRQRKICNRILFKKQLLFGQNFTFHSCCWCCNRLYD